MMKWILFSLLIVAGLLLLIQKKSRQQLFHQEKEEQKILLVSGLILFWVALIGELSGLGILDKIDKMASYQYIYQQLKIIGPVFLLSIIGGVLLLYWQVSPLVHKLVLSEKDAQLTNKLLKESENRFRSAFDYSSIGIGLLAFDGKWLKVNSAMCDMLEFAEEEFLQMNFQSLMHADDLLEIPRFLLALQQNNITNAQMEKRLVSKSGGVKWARINVSLVCDELHKPVYFILQIQDIEKQRSAEEQLRHMAFHDALTGLDNRLQIDKNLDRALEYAQLNEKYFALIYLDLDHFKVVNDSLGHESGDKLLMTVAQRLKSVLRHSDKIGRLGGDEFIIVIEDFLNPDIITDIVQKIHVSLEVPIILRGKEVLVTTSIGISIYPIDGADVATLMLNADTALYRAKEKGRNNFQFFAESYSVI
jgi:diguanylate cyclase (GGDEF)-like protein/PAS domain S-box-containing protein